MTRKKERTMLFEFLRHPLLLYGVLTACAVSSGSAAFESKTGSDAAAPNVESMLRFMTGTNEADAETWYNNMRQAYSQMKNRTKKRRDLLACAAGKYSTGFAGLKCKDCPSGKYKSSTGKGSCSSCETSTSTSKGTLGSKSADEACNCIQGTIRVNGECVCGAGKYFSGGCEDCPSGKYKSSSGMLGCSSCETSTSTSKGTSGSKSADEACNCIQGTNRDSLGECVWCTAGTFDNGSECQTCASGYYQSTCGQMTCHPCPEGKYTSDGQACNDCNSGKYVNPAATDCLSCPSAGYECENSRKRPCPPGKYSDTNDQGCKACPTGRFSLVEMSSVCTSCQKGTYNEIEGSSKPCTACPLGRYGDATELKSLIECKSCATVSDKMTTKYAGATSSSECSCKPGTFADPTAIDLHQLCSTCPHGSVCNNDMYGETLYTLQSQPGFWRKGYDSSVFHKCLNKDMCKGGPVLPMQMAQQLTMIALSYRSENRSIRHILENVSSHFNTSENVNGQCSEGYSGTLCLSCAADFLFTAQSNECIYCPSGKSTELALSAIVLTFIATFSLLLTCLFAIGSNTLDSDVGELAQDRLDGSAGNEEDVARNSTGGKHIRTLTAQVLSVGKISAGFLQIISSMTFVFDLEWPLQVKWFFSLFKVVNLDFLNLFRWFSPCGLSMDYTVTFYFHLSLVPLSSLCIVVAYFARFSFLKLRILCGQKCGDRCGGRFKVAGGATAALEVTTNFEQAKKKLGMVKKKCKQEEKLCEATFEEKKENLRAAREALKVADKKTDDLKAAAKAASAELKAAKESLLKLEKENSVLVQNARKTTAEARRAVRNTQGIKQVMAEERKNAIARMLKYFNLVLFVVYPGLTVRIFRLFKCEAVMGGASTVLEADPSIVCGEDDWNGMKYTAYVFIVLYVVGIPLGTLMVLRKNRAALWDTKHKYHIYMMNAYGNLFEPYKERFYYWDVIEMNRKMVMTGGLILVGAGSSAQLFIAQWLTLIYMLLVLKLAPFRSLHDDWLSFVMSLQIMVTLMLAFALKTKGNTPTSKIDEGAYEDEIMGLIMVLLSCIALMCAVLCILLVVRELLHDHLSESESWKRLMAGKCCCRSKVTSCSRTKKETRQKQGRTQHDEHRKGTQDQRRNSQGKRGEQSGGHGRNNMRTQSNKRKR